MHFTAPIVLSALAASALAQTTVYSNAAPRATATILAGSDVGAPTLVYWGGWATDGTRMFNFGGRGVDAAGTALTTYFNGLDAYNPSINTWTNLSVQGAVGAPSNRFRAAMAYDPTGNRLVVFGGSPSPAVPLSDCFEFNLGTNTWSAIPNPTPGTTGPTGRWDATMQFDAATGSLVLFGGQTGTASTTRVGDTWLLSGSSWVQLTPATSPSPRGLHAMTSRMSPYNDIVLIGGQDTANALLTDLWRWDGAAASWVAITPINATVPVTWCSGNAAVHDPVRQVVTIIGGTGTGTAPSNTMASGGWSSEYDCVTNEWRAYGNSTTSQDADDPVWGNLQRFCVAFLNGRIFFWGGQNVPTIGDANLRFVKEYQANPLANAVPYGSGCNGQSGNLLTLTADTTPWTGRTWQGTCTNLGGASFALAPWSLTSAALPLVAILPGFGQPGCTLLNTADVILGPVLPAAGQASITLAIPNTASLAGTVLYTQVTELDFGITSLWSSNGLTLTLGAL